MARPLAPALMVLLAVSAGGCAHWWPWESGNDWEISRTKRFTAYARAGTDHTATLTALELSYAILQSSLFKAPAIAPVDVLLLDWPEFRSTLGTQRTGATIAELPGKGTYGRHGLIVMYGLDTTTAGALHRLVHLFLYASAPRAPLWLHEGLATYAETAVFREGERDGVACLGQLPQKQPDIPLKDLFAWSWPSFDDAQRDPNADARSDDKGGAKPESKAGSSYRFTASNVVDYFMMGEAGKLRDKLPALVAALAEGAGTEAALAKVYPDLTLAVLQDKTREHRTASESTLRSLCPIAYPVPAEPFAESAKPKVEPATPEDADQLFARLRMLPRRAGNIDWFPPAMIGVEGGQFGQPAGTP